jgi:Tol biopolymer transport system component
MRLAAVALCSSLFVTATSAQEIEIRKLNGPLARIVTGDVTEPQLSPDGEWAVFLADREVDDRPELYAAPSDGSLPAVKLSAPLGSGSIMEFRITPDSARVVYRLEGNLDELRSVPIDGSGPAVQLNTDPLAQIFAFDVDASGGRLAFLAAENGGSDEHQVYAAPVDGSAPSLRLNPPLPVGANVGDFAMSPDGTRVVYAADQEVAFVRELFAVPSTGGAGVKLSGPRVATADVLDLAISPDSARVVYRANQLVDSTFELFTAPIDGSLAPLPLTSPAVHATDDYRFGAFGRLLFTDGSTLYSVPADASGPMTAFGALGGPYRFTPDGTRVVFESYSSGTLLISRPVDGSLPGRVIAGPSAPDFQVYRSLVLFRAVDLFAVPVDGSLPPFELDRSGTLAGVDGFALDRDGDRAVFVRGGRLYSVSVNDFDGVTELASDVQPESALFVARRPALTHARRAADGRELSSADVVFLRQLEGVDELLTVPLDGSRAPLVLNQPFTLTQPAGAVDGFLVRGPWVVYRAQEQQANVDQLFAQRLDQPGPAVELAGPVPSFPAELSAGVIALPSGRYVYQLGSRLLSVPLDGSAGVELTATIGGNFPAFHVDADETRIAFLQASGFSLELWIRPVDGGAPMLRLSPSGVNVRDFELSPDGTRAVYRADAVAQNEIFSVPLDGSAPPVKLNGAIAPSYEGVRSYGFSPDGQRLVYVAYQDADPFPSCTARRSTARARCRSPSPRSSAAWTMPSSRSRRAASSSTRPRRHGGQDRALQRAAPGRLRAGSS